MGQRENEIRARRDEEIGRRDTSWGEKKGGSRRNRAERWRRGGYRLTQIVVYCHAAVLLFTDDAVGRLKEPNGRSKTGKSVGRGRESECGMTFRRQVTAMGGNKKCAASLIITR